MKLAQGVTVRPAYNLLLAVFSKVVAVRSALLDGLNPGQRREIITSPGIISRVYGPNTLSTILDLPFALLFIAVLFLLQRDVAMVASVFIVIAFVIAAISHLPITKPQKQQSMAANEAAAIAANAMRRPDTARAFNARAFLNNRWKQHQTVATKAGMTVESRRNFFQTLTKTIGALMGVAVIGVGAKLTVAGDMDMGMMIGANIVAARAIAPIIAFAQLGPALTEVKRAMELLGGFSKLPQERLEGRELPDLDGSLEINDLSFAHMKENDPLFESLSLELERGKSLLVVGGNGVGKTTLSRLLMGILEPTRGQVSINGINMDQISLDWWRRQVAYLPQEPDFIDGTIRENLMTLNPNISDKQLQDVTAEAGLTEFLHSHPKGLEAPLFNDGSNLASGVRKRLALARALTSANKRAIFDEPMEGMDSQGRSAVSQVLGAFIRNGRSVIVFSHDAGLVSGTDMVLDLDQKPVPKLTHRNQAPAAGNMVPPLPKAVS